MPYDPWPHTPDTGQRPAGHGGRGPAAAGTPAAAVAVAAAAAAVAAAAAGLPGWGGMPRPSLYPTPYIGDGGQGGGGRAYVELNR